MPASDYSSFTFANQNADFATYVATFVTTTGDFTLCQVVINSCAATSEGAQIVKVTGGPLPSPSPQPSSTPTATPSPVPSGCGGGGTSGSRRTPRGVLGACGGPTPVPSPTPTRGRAILDEPLQTDAFPDGSPNYAFGFPAAAGGPDQPGPDIVTASGMRSPRDLGIGLCRGTIAIDVRASGTTAGTVPAEYDLRCALGGDPGAQPTVYDIHVVRHTYRFKDQDAEVPGEDHDYYVRCNRTLCRGTLDVGLSAGSNIIDFEAFFSTRGYVDPESNHTHRRVPFNSRAEAYPEIIDTRHIRGSLSPFVEFPSGHTDGKGRQIQNCQGRHRHQSGCEKRDRYFRTRLDTAYSSGDPWPYADRSYVSRRQDIEGHHIQELQWGGDNSLQNGVLLLKLDHVMLSDWWRSVFGY